MHSRFVSFLASASLLFACEPTPRCVRRSVDRSGFLSSPFDTASVPQLLVLEARATVKVFAPISSCTWDTPSFTVELLDADNLSAEFEAPTLTTNDESAVSIEVSFTPKKPGMHLLHVRFEPNLGARTLLLLVADAADVQAGVVVPMKVATCSAGVWPLGEDSAVCARASDFTVSFVDGGTQRFPGRDIATSGRALWSLSPADQLERFELRDGALLRTHQWSDVFGNAIAGLHTETLAVRRQFDQAAVFDASDAGQRFFESIPAQAPPTLFVPINDAVIEIGPQGCASGRGNCNTRSPPNGVEAERVWSAVEPPHFVRVWTFDGFENPTPTLLLDRALPTVTPTGPFEVMPLWVDATLVGRVDGQLSAVTWPKDRVLKVGSRVVVLRETVESVRLVPR